jgi:hypothetical protein
MCARSRGTPRRNWNSSAGNVGLRASYFEHVRVIHLPIVLREVLFVSIFPLVVSCLACPIISLTLIVGMRCSSILAKINALVITAAISAVQLLACLPHVQ